MPPTVFCYHPGRTGWRRLAEGLVSGSEPVVREGRARRSPCNHSHAEQESTMSHDTYYPCPCGSGRKVKFCCGKQVAAELDKIMRALGGDQQAAALNLVRLARGKFPDNPALLVLQCELEMDQDDEGTLQETLAHLYQVAPRNPSALALMAINAAKESRGEDAIGYLQDALESVEQQVPELLYEALGIVAQVSLLSQSFAATFSHLLLQAAIRPEGDHRPLESLKRFSALGQVPMAFKFQRFLQPLDEDAPDTEPFATIQQLAGRGRWRSACEMLEAINQQTPNQPRVLYDLAALQMRLGWNDEAAVNLGRLASIPGLPLQEAVEAEALAQLLDPDDQETVVEQVTSTFEITDAEGALERMLSDRRLNAMPDEVRRSARGEDEPPPKAGFWVLDRALPSDGAELAWQDIPLVVGQALLFGRQTDRQARLEFTCFRDEKFEEHKNWLLQLLGDTGRFASEEVRGGLPAAQLLFTWRWRFPDGMTEDRRLQAVEEMRRQILLEKWCNLKMPELDGRSPLEAAEDPGQHIRLQALVLNLELDWGQVGWDFDMNVLREKLRLPTVEPIELAEGLSSSLPLERVGYVRVESLSDEDLMILFQRSMGIVAWPILQRLMEELERRQPALADRFDYGDAYAAMAGTAGDSESVLTYLDKARVAVEARGGSPAQFLLASLPHLIQTGRPDELNATINTLQQKHIREPGIAQALYEFLTMLQNTLQQRGGGAPSPMGGGAPGLGAGEGASGPEPAAAPGQLWTPDSAPASSGGEGSKIWVPGMD
jgi:tetratricopeptide (TPR) repeat protein